MVSIWDELVWETVKQQNIMARNTFVIVQGCSNHGQGKGRGREGEREGGRKGRVEIKDQEEALAKTNLGPVLQRKCSETQAQRMYCEALGKWGVRLHGQAVGPGPDAGC